MPHKPGDLTIREMRVVPLFDRLGSEDITNLAALTTHKTYKAGTAVFFQDDPSDSLYIIVAGSARVFQTSEDGKDRILSILRAGEASADRVSSLSSSKLSLRNSFLSPDRRTTTRSALSLAISEFRDNSITHRPGRFPFTPIHPLNRPLPAKPGQLPLGKMSCPLLNEFNEFFFHARPFPLL